MFAISQAPQVPALQYAISDLKDAFHGDLIVESSAASLHGAAARIVIGIAGQSPLVDGILKKKRLTLPSAPESLIVEKLAGSPETVLLAGRDARGLMYAVLEAADAVRCAPAGGDPFALLATGSESPALKHRSLSVHLHNADVDKSWYYSTDFWNQYFDTLARSRFNTFVLGFGDQTNYMAPPYPWLFDIPEYPNVGVHGLSSDDRARNIAMLRTIGQLATDHGLDFGVAIWQQAPIVNIGEPAGPTSSNYGFGPVQVENLPKGADLAAYNAKAFARLIKECPTISLLQLRLNHESGIPDSIQHQYFSTLFDEMKHGAIPVRVELRYKGLSQDTVDQAVSAGLDTTVSTKFWCEHLGLPFHPVGEEPLYAASRYGYGTLLKSTRNYKVAYQLWNQGSSRVFLWGDPEYAARTAQSCVLGDGDTFEVFAPLSNKGYGNAPGAWRIMAKPELEYYTWEQERYWMFYLSHGRTGYDPKTSDIVWKREFARRFGKAGESLVTAYRAASRVLPLVTAAAAPSGSEWSYWPEMDVFPPVSAYAVTQPSDCGLFYGIRSWKSLGDSRMEERTPTFKGFAEDAIDGKLDAKITPVQVADELDRLAAEALTAIDTAEHQSPTPASAELRSTATDIRALAYLAQYHAAKKRAATQLGFFGITHEPGRLNKAYDYTVAEAAAWDSLTRVTDHVYSNNLAFGPHGHWKDHLTEVRADVAYVKDMVAKYNATGQDYRVYPGENPPAELPVITHTPVVAATPGADVAIAAHVTSKAPLRAVLLHYRRMDQTVPWTVVPMIADGSDRYSATIPGDKVTPTWDLIYYVEALVEGGGTIWPNWRTDAPYVKITVQR
jgi:hypothetical protein